MKKTRFHVRWLADSGIGKPWMAESLGPWTPGDPTCVKYIYPRKTLPAYFVLEPNKVYVCEEPHWKRPAEGDPPLAEDDQIEVRRYYVVVDAAGKATEISDRAAEERLKHLRKGM